MNEIDWTGVIFGFGVLVLGTTILVVALMQVGAFSRAKVARRDEERYREIVGRYETTAAQQNRLQEAAAASLADVRDRLTEIERILREVE